MDTNIIEYEALHLPPSDRSRLAHILEKLSEFEVEEVWFNIKLNVVRVKLMMGWCN